MQATEDARGILFPARLPRFYREPAPSGLEGLVRWFWLPRWDLPPGHGSRQEILPFPASNLVVAPDGVSLAGPTTRLARRELRGSGWVLGALLRPAGLVRLHAEPWRIRDVEVPVDAPGLASAVARELEIDDEAARRRAVKVVATWLAAHGGEPDDGGLLANAMEDLVATEREIVRVEQLAARLGLSVRTVQRLARRYVGVTPLAIIRRYRLQEAAQRLRELPGTSIAEVAAELGYADQAHLAADFRTVLGFTPSSYREPPRERPLG